MLTFRQIRYFISIVEHGNVSSAASELNVSQSTVSAAIKNLEEHLGIRLFERKAFGLSLSFQGNQFLQHAQNILAAVSDATNAPYEPSEEMEGDVAIGVSIAAAAYLLPNLLLRFKQIFPKVTTHIVENDRKKIEQKIINGKLDIAMMLISTMNNIPALESKVFRGSQRRLWLSANHPFTQKETVSLAEIQHEPYIMLVADEANKLIMKIWKKTAYRPNNVIFETKSVEAVRSMVGLGLGITILSDLIYRPWSLEGRKIETRNVTEKLSTLDIGIVWHRDAELSLPSRTFRDFAIRAYQNPPPPPSTLEVMKRNPKINCFFCGYH